jgi:hypothetical protein
MLARACQHRPIFWCRLGRGHRPFFDVGKGLPVGHNFFMALAGNLGYCHIVVHSHLMYHVTLIPGGVAPPLAAPPSFFSDQRHLTMLLFSRAEVRNGAMPNAILLICGNYSGDTPKSSS